MIQSDSSRLCVWHAAIATTTGNALPLKCLHSLCDNVGATWYFTSDRETKKPKTSRIMLTMCQITQIVGGNRAAIKQEDAMRLNIFPSSCLCCVITDSSSLATAARETPSLPFVSQNEDDQTPEAAVCSTSLT